MSAQFSIALSSIVLAILSLSSSAADAPPTPVLLNLSRYSAFCGNLSNATSPSNASALPPINTTVLFFNYTRENQTNGTQGLWTGASCLCQNGTLMANFSNQSEAPWAYFLQQSLEGSVAAGGAYSPAQLPSEGGIARVVSFSCIPAKPTVPVIYQDHVEVITIINNVTHVVTVQNQSFIYNLQKEVDAFLSSFSNPATFFYGSNVGIGELANVMLWVGFLVFCLLSIFLQWMSYRQRKPPRSLLLLTVNSAATMLGYLTMAFGHGRAYDATLMLTAEKNASGAVYLQGKVMFYPRVPPLFYAQYIMWAAATPSVLFLLGQLAGATLPRKLLLYALDIAMLLMGLVGSYADDPSVHWGFFTGSSAAFALLIHQLHSLAPPLPPLRRAPYKKLVWLVTVTWSLYPLVWVLGHQGANVLDTDEEVEGYLWVEVLTKLSFVTAYLIIERRATVSPRTGKSHPDSDSLFRRILARLLGPTDQAGGADPAGGGGAAANTRDLLRASMGRLHLPARAAPGGSGAHQGSTHPLNQPYSLRQQLAAAGGGGGGDGGGGVPSTGGGGLGKRWMNRSSFRLTDMPGPVEGGIGGKVDSEAAVPAGGGDDAAAAAGRRGAGGVRGATRSLGRMLGGGRISISESPSAPDRYKV